VTGSGTVQANCRGLKDSPYDWQVRAKDEDGGISSWVVMSGTPDFTVTAGMDVGIDATAPVDGTLSATPNDQVLDLSWTEADDGLVGIGLDPVNTYKLVRATEPSVPADYCTDAGIYIGNGNAYFDTGLSNGTQYNYRVCAYDKLGNGSIGTTVSGTPSSAPTTTIGNGADPSDNTEAEPGTLQYIDEFTLVTNTGIDQVTEVQVTTPTNTSEIVDVGVYDNVDALIASQNTPAGNVWTIDLSGSPLNINTTPLDYRIEITLKDHAAMAVGSWPITARVTNFTAGNLTAGLDSSSATITADNDPPADASWGTNSPEYQQVVLNWNNPADSDFAEVIILRETSSITDAPTDGQTYSTGPFPAGTSEIIYVGGLETFTDTGLTNGQIYYYKIFSRDNSRNHAAGVETSEIPNGLTTIGNGTDPADNTEAEPGTLQYIDEFTLVTNAATDQVTEVQVTTPTNTSEIADVGVYDNLDALIASQNTPAGNVWTIDLSGSPLNVNITPSDYRIEITLKDHAAMAVGSWSITATVTGFTAGNLTAGVDSGSATITADNDPPADASWGTNTPGDQQVVLNWNNPVDTDFAEVIVLRETSSITDAPTDGQTYSTGPFPAGTSEIIYVGALQTFTDTSRTNGQIYYYRIFSRDNSKNYAAGVETSETPSAVTTVGNGTDPSLAPTVEPGTVNYVDQFTLSTSSGTDTVTGLTVTTTNTTEVASVEIKDNTNTISYGTQSTAAGDDWSITLSPQIGINTSALPLRVYITLKDHASMTVGTWAITATVTSITTGNASISYEDAGSDTITADNAPPADTTWGTNVPGDQQIVLNWTNPVSDFAEVIILRETVSITDAPTDGQTYVLGPFPSGTSEIIYVGGLETFTDTGLTNGETYYYKIFSRDNVKNYASGAETSVTIPEIDVDPPASAITDPADSTAFNSGSPGTINITGTASDNVAVSSVEVQINGGGWSPATCTGCPGVNIVWSYSWPRPASEYSDSRRLGAFINDNCTG
jgi:hypothetical protein